MTSTKRYALATVKVPDSEPDDAFPGTFDVILSTPDVDRDGEIVAARAFDPLPGHITFDVDHGMTTETTVGSGVPNYEPDGRLRVRGTWSSLPRAQAVRTLVREGHVRTTSVAYMAAEYAKDTAVPTVIKAELLNGAIVSIPSNRGAVVLSSKAYEDAQREAGPVLGIDDAVLRRLDELEAAVKALTPTDSTTDSAPGKAADPAAISSASVVTRALAEGHAALALSQPADVPSITQGG